MSRQDDEPPWSINPPAPPTDLVQITQKCIDTYMLSKQDDGGIRGIGWWQQANGYTAITLHDTYLGSKHNYHLLVELLKKSDQRNTNFINEFNDDSLWWGLTSLHIYNQNGDDWFLSKAKAVWNHLPQTHSILQRGQATFAGEDMEGACLWTTKPNEEQINSITTGLFAELSTRLALHEQSLRPHLSPSLKRSHPSSKIYLDHALRSLNWILHHRFRREQALVLDNILLHQQRAQDWTWSYNTGVAMGVCALLFEATAETRYLALACEMAEKAVRRGNWVEGSSGVLTEPDAYSRGRHDPNRNNDAVGFKSVLMRGLGEVYGVIRRREMADGFGGTADLIKAFVNVNLRSQLERNTDGRGRYGPWWGGPFECPTSHSQMAVLDVMAAAVLVNRT